jgi:hypothetical protein
MRKQRVRIVVISALLGMFVGAMGAAPATAAGHGTTCFGTIWTGTDAQYSTLSIKNCSTRTAWIALDNGQTSITYLAKCVAPGGTIAVDRSYRAGPIRTGANIAPTNCVAGMTTGVAYADVKWGAKSL